MTALDSVSRGQGCVERIRLGIGQAGQGVEAVQQFQRHEAWMDDFHQGLLPAHDTGGHCQEEGVDLALLPQVAGCGETAVGREAGLGAGLQVEERIDHGNPLRGESGEKAVPEGASGRGYKGGRVESGR